MSHSRTAVRQRVDGERAPGSCVRPEGRPHAALADAGGGRGRRGRSDGALVADVCASASRTWMVGTPAAGSPPPPRRLRHGVGGGGGSGGSVGGGGGRRVLPPPHPRHTLYLTTPSYAPTPSAAPPSRTRPLLAAPSGRPRRAPAPPLRTRRAAPSGAARPWAAAGVWPAVGVPRQQAHPHTAPPTAVAGGRGDRSRAGASSGWTAESHCHAVTSGVRRPASGTGAAVRGARRRCRHRHCRRHRHRRRLPPPACGRVVAHGERGRKTAAVVPRRRQEPMAFSRHVKMNPDNAPAMLGGAAPAASSLPPVVPNARVDSREISVCAPPSARPARDRACCHGWPLVGDVMQGPPGPRRTLHPAARRSRRHPARASPPPTH